MSADKDFYLPTENRLLTVLSETEYQRLVPNLEQVNLEVKQVLYQANKPITHVYFPHQAIVSLVYTQKDGSMIEAGMVGNDGMVGVSVVWGSNITNTTALVQITGSSLMIKTELLLLEFNRGGELQNLLLRYTHKLFTQVTQTLACNSLHTIEQRFARCLLLIAARMQSETFCVTQEYIAKMLGCRRTGVTQVANRLSRAGMISYKRGTINILNRSGLQDTSCECYSMIKDEYARLLSVPIQPALDKGSREQGAESREQGK
ncbi:cAMP-binding domain of CRP or a regulatory subunit of cAMP-dependent protein kinases (plasmid) [Nostoc flagelliforme CCNUN1]|uniref:cAMP-binding domain of CRP or a regulatory subunit of cAMP-dependent protein kinases n=1 Tax=Nostoc flagelliforme CCNUN1 TaxID=2038116 RepID=A0A2K8TAD4_9NOSO|nr:Crp/Fnr family transcriptional regulator [Nostoc flagelliforme]AUB44657.1 cAMP-binding domain of CRP or a regulatory subunit of cAMP-dependent protein kinases [Nostoc flagelliforme CCNUN1]